MTIARYTFLPWLRRGIANQMQTPAGPGASRASLAVSLVARSDAADSPVPARTVRLAGPGDIARILAEQVVRTEPRGTVADFEPNYLAAIDFYDEDFAWRYSPLAVDSATHRLAPWLALVVLKQTEFERIAVPGRDLPFLKLKAGVKRTDLFPPPGQEWAWAHVHLNEALPGTASAPDLGALASRLDHDPDVACCRLISPRKLQPNTGYEACVIPSFEVGRKAGLGQLVADNEDGSVRSWAGGADEFPIYYEWSFRTGVEGDFESLVRALVPRDVDPQVGIRDMDVSNPEFGIASVSNPPDGRVGLEGALLSPTTKRRGLADSSNFVERIVPVLNAPADAQVAGEADPVIAPPIYGCWYHGVDRVQATGSGWLTELNLDPRARAAAGLGARVIRSNQEQYMRIAWEQIGDVITVNSRIRRAQLAIKASSEIHQRSFAPLAAERIALLSAPVFSKVLGSPVTLRALVTASRLPRASLSIGMRRLLRPRGPLARRALPPGLRQKAAAGIVHAINSGEASAAPPRDAPGGATLEGTTAATAPPVSPLHRYRWLILALLLLLAILLLVIAPLLAILAIAALVASAFWLLKAAPIYPPATIFSEEGLKPEAIVATPAQPDNVFDPEVEPSLPPSAAPPMSGGVPGDSVAAADLRRALTDFQASLAIRVDPEPERKPLDLRLVASKALAATEPHHAIAARFAPLMKVGGRSVRDYARERYTGGRGGEDRDTIREVMNHPDIKLPMYAPLDAISGDYFVPNLRLIPNNTISLMEVNQRFIESYFLGLNHEFARELLWREYPTDQQGTCFRQFWDVTGFVDPLGRDPKTLAEALKDIPRIHRWKSNDALGTHNNRDADGDGKQLVLVVRGDLLKRYPNTFIYAQRAQWGTAQRANRLVLSDETGELFTTSPTDTRLKFPLYRAHVAPDIHFIGFDLSIDEVRGDPRLDETAAAKAMVGGSNLGWFFVLQEAIGEPRFGMDVDRPVEPSANKWDNLSWADIDFGAGEAVDLGKAFLSSPGGSDEGVKWNSDAADMASILYQDPVMVGVHGRNMLRNLGSEAPHA